MAVVGVAVVRVAVVLGDDHPTVGGSCPRRQMLEWQLSRWLQS